MSKQHYTRGQAVALLVVGIGYGVFMSGLAASIVSAQQRSRAIEAETERVRREADFVKAAAEAIQVVEGLRLRVVE